MNTGNTQFEKSALYNDSKYCDIAISLKLESFLAHRPNRRRRVGPCRVIAQSRGGFIVKNLTLCKYNREDRLRQRHQVTVHTPLSVIGMLIKFSSCCFLVAPSFFALFWVVRFVEIDLYPFMYVIKACFVSSMYMYITVLRRDVASL